jgi:hypothetical protein
VHFSFPPCVLHALSISPSFRMNDCRWNLDWLLSEYCRSQWPRGLRCGSPVARLLRLWVRIPSGAWRFVCCECCVLSSRGLYDELITCPVESYRMWCVVGCDLETWPKPTQGCRADDVDNDDCFNVNYNARRAMPQAVNR